MSKNAACLLVDNGSLKPASTLALRRVAASLAQRLGRVVEPVSLLHSSIVPAHELDGEPAEILEPAIRKRYARGIREFLLLPLFFGPSGALVDYVPKRVSALRRDLPELRVHMAQPLVDVLDEGDNRVAEIVSEHARVVIRNRKLARPLVVVVDHGSPQREVAAVRDHVAAHVRTILRDEARAVIASSMERREGAEYDFCEPLLERALATAPCGADAGDVIIAMLFLSPGRHAGPGGDVEQICRAAENANVGLRTHITPLVGEHPLLIDVLADRYREATGAGLSRNHAVDP